MNAGDRVESSTGLSGIVIHIHGDEVWVRWDTDRGMSLRHLADYVWNKSKLTAVPVGALPGKAET